MPPSKLKSSLELLKKENSDISATCKICNKDLCSLCEKYKNSTEEQQLVMKHEIENHRKNKELSRQLKDHKERAKVDRFFCAAVFDLEQVLQTPKCEVSEQYYRSKLSTYNLTFYSLAENQGYCFMWYEALGQRGSNEVSSCVIAFIKEKVEMENIQEFSFFSDNCGGQNRNKNIISMYVYCAINFSVRITHYYLEKGHAQNEGDSIHSNIEKASRNINNLQYSTEGEKVNWNNIKIIQRDHQAPEVIRFKYNYWDEDYQQINIRNFTHQKKVMFS